MSVRRQVKRVEDGAVAQWSGGAVATPETRVRSPSGVVFGNSHPGGVSTILKILGASAQRFHLVRRKYLVNGPCQAREFNFPYSEFEVKRRRFIPDWFDEFGSLLEYSEEKDRAYCFCCFLLFLLQSPQ